MLPEGPFPRCSQDWPAKGGTCRPRVGKRISVGATLNDRLQGRKTERGGTGCIRSLVSGASCPPSSSSARGPFLFLSVRAPCNPGQNQGGGGENGAENKRRQPLVLLSLRCSRACTPGRWSFVRFDLWSSIDFFQTNLADGWPTIFATMHSKDSLLWMGCWNEVVKSMFCLQFSSDCN